MLSDPEKRKQYDAFGSADGRVGGFPGGGGPGAGGFNFDFGDISDLFGGFGDIFGRSRGREQATRGADLQAEVSLSFEDSLRGIETQIPVQAELACRECGGSGAHRARRRRSAPSARAAASRSRARACSGSRTPARAAAATAR